MDELRGRRLVLQALVIGGGLLLAGCAVVPKGPPKTTGPVTPPPGDVLPVDPGRHRIALLLPLTGPNAGIGNSIANAANMAVLDTGGLKMRLTSYDTALGTEAAVTKALADGNRVILGPLLVEDVKIAADATRKAKVPLISYANDVTLGGKGVYVMGFTPGQSMDRIVGYVRSKGMTRFAALVPMGPYGDAALAGFRSAIAAQGGTLVTAQTYDRNTGAILGAVARLNRAGTADAILIADSAKTAIQAVPVLRRNGNPTARILGTELWNADSNLALAKPIHSAWFASVSDGVYNQFATKYRTRYSSSPYRLASLGYDSILLLAKIANQPNLWTPGKAFPIAALEDKGGFAGIDGAFRFLPTGVAERALEVQQVGPKGATIIAPAPKVLDVAGE